MIKTANIWAVIIIALAIFFRIYNLGFSNFQGDEVKALGFLFTKDTFINFLLSNSKGPGQYIVTYLLYSIKPLFFDTEMFYRIPFVVAGIASVLLVYKLAKVHMSNYIFPILLIGFGGFFIGFSRIVQYQSFVVLFGILTAYYVLKYFDKLSRDDLLRAGIFSAVGLLFHYDALSYILPVIVSLIYFEKKLQRKSLIDSIKRSGFYLLPIAIALVFYLPFILGNNFQNTSNYLVGQRISGYFNFDSFFYSVNLLSIYNPFFINLSYVLALAYMLVDKKHTNRYKTFALYTAVSLLIMFLLLKYSSETPRRMLTYPSILLFLFAFVLTDKSNPKKMFIKFWTAITFVSYFLIFKKPLSHIYACLLPLSLYTGFINLQPLREKLKWKSSLLVTIIVVLASIFCYQVFIDTRSEYPTNSKRYLLLDIPMSKIRIDEVAGLFGFVYYRNYESLSNELNGINPQIKNYTSNEENERLKFYLNEYNWSDIKPFYFIEVSNPKETVKGTRPFTSQPILSNEYYSVYIIE